MVVGHNTNKSKLFVGLDGNMATQIFTPWYIFNIFLEGMVVQNYSGIIIN